jgi:hypothetical protein
MAGVAGGARINDILVESQKMIYAPPSREKSKQTMRSPMLDKNQHANLQPGGAPIAGTVQSFVVNNGVINSDEYMMSGGGMYTNNGGQSTVSVNGQQQQFSKRKIQNGVYGNTQGGQQMIQIKNMQGSNTSQVNSGGRGSNGNEKYQSIHQNN